MGGGGGGGISYPQSRTLIYETMSSHISGILLSIRALIGDPAVVEEMFRSLFFLQITTTNASILDLVTRPCLIVVTGNGYGRHSLSESYSQVPNKRGGPK